MSSIPNGQQTLIDVYLRAKAEMRLEQNIAMHSLGQGGEIVGNASAKLDMAEATIPSGAIWKARLVFGNGRLGDSPASFGVAIYDGKGLLPLSEGTGDWNGSRYLFELEWKAQ